IELARNHGERGYEAWGLRILGELDIAANASSSDHLQRALEISTGLGLRPTIAHSHAGLARLHRKRGDSEPASQHRPAALALYGQVAIEWWPAIMDADSLGGVLFR